jgi:hypothetical protein
MEGCETEGDITEDATADNFFRASGAALLPRDLKSPFVYL